MSKAQMLRFKAAELMQVRLNVPLSFLQYAESLAKLCDEAINEVDIIEHEYELARPKVCCQEFFICKEIDCVPRLNKKIERMETALSYCRELLADLSASKVEGTRVWNSMKLILEAQGELDQLELKNHAKQTTSV